MTVWQSTHFTFKKDASCTTKDSIIQRLQRLGEDCGGHAAGIITHIAERNVDHRSSVDFVQITAFADPASVNRYRKHSAHISFVAAVCKCADWRHAFIETIEPSA